MENNGDLKGLTVFITGANRGIGFAIAKKIAKDGANIVIAARTVVSSPGYEETIYSAAKLIEECGGNCLPCQMDIRDVKQIESAIQQAVQKFGGIDIVINNCSNLNMTSVLETTVEKYDTMHQIIPRGVFLTSKLCYPYLKKSRHPHILNLSPPINMDKVWLKMHAPYTTNKYSVSMYTIGMSEEFKEEGIAVNSLWPKLVIYSSGMIRISGEKAKKYCRSVDIVADAAYAILKRNPKSFTGNLTLDEEVLLEEGINDFERYRADPGWK